MSKKIANIVTELNPLAMNRSEQLMNSIKKNSPGVYQILKKQMAQKWEITTGTKFKTTDQTTLNKHQQAIAESQISK